MSFDRPHASLLLRIRLPSPDLCVAVLTGMLSFFVSAAHANEVYLTPENFVKQAFAGETPKPETIWITGALRAKVEAVLAHKTQVLRIRYWRQKRRTAWVLEEMGKEKNITVGIIVDQEKIELLKTLIYRESRGWEVREDFFTRQFIGRFLTDASQLDAPIDSISGATLSVQSVTKLGRLALLLDQTIQGQP